MIGEDIELATTLAAGLTQVRADRSQLEQVVMNLVINARDACGPGGKIRLVTEAVDIDGAIAAPRLVENRGAYVALSVIDNGTGVERATNRGCSSRSSRPSHAGGALVLDSPRSTASWFREVGRFRSRASSGAGSRFTVFLPREDEATPLVSRVAETPAPTSSQTVLLVEDEQARTRTRPHHPRARGPSCRGMNKVREVLKH